MDTELLNRAIVGRWFTEFWGQTCNLGIVDELAQPDVLLQYSMHSPRCGRQAVKIFMAEFRESFPDLAFRKIGNLTSDRDIVVVRWEAAGTHSGPAYHDFHIGPLAAASGTKIEMCGHTAVRLENGLIAEEAIWSTERKASVRPITSGLLV
jgi:hypothetical protein